MLKEKSSLVLLFLLGSFSSLFRQHNYRGALPLQNGLGTREFRWAYTDVMAGARHLKAQVKHVYRSELVSSCFVCNSFYLVPWGLGESQFHMWSSPFNQSILCCQVEIFPRDVSFTLLCSAVCFSSSSFCLFVLFHSFLVIGFMSLTL